MPITKAILTGGGRATRLRPITTTLNKHLIPLAGKPMIFYAIEKAVEAGITEIFINTNPGDTQLAAAVGNGERWGISITYFEQPGGPQGIAHVVNAAKKFVGRDSFMFYLSDNIILNSLAPLFKKFESENLDCLLALSKVDDPTRFGVPQFNAAGELSDVIEKPAVPPSNFAVTGIYVYRSSFFKAFKHIEKSARGEYEISSIHSYLLKEGYQVGYEEITGWWKDTGQPQDLITLNHLLLDQKPTQEFFCASPVSQTVRQGDKVALGRNVHIGQNVKLNSPLIIEDNCQLENCSIGPYVTVGQNSTIKQASLRESIVFGGCRLEAAVNINQSILGQATTIIPHHEGDFQRLVVGDQTLIEL